MAELIVKIKEAHVKGIIVSLVPEVTIHNWERRAMALMCYHDPVCRASLATTISVASDRTEPLWASVPDL